MDITGLLSFHQAAISSLPERIFRRYLFDQIDWSENGITIIGERGVGKTTLLLQWALEHGEPGSFLYVSGDYFEMHSLGLYNIAAHYFRHLNGKVLIIDEIHKYQNWKVELKNILDAFKNKKILISGSSAIHLREWRGTKSTAADATSDLERRRVIYQLEGLSFREYLNFKFDLVLPSITLPVLVRESFATSNKMIQSLRDKDTTVLYEFKNYLCAGYYPYFIEAPSSYRSRVMRTIDAVIDNDISHVLDLNVESSTKLKKLLSMIASSKPFTPSIENLSKDLGVSRPTLYKYINYLKLAGLIRAVYSDISKAAHIMTKPEKIAVANPNLLSSLRDFRITGETSGSLRETFFVSNFDAKRITAARHGDYGVDGYTFEIGGSNKNMKQIATIDDAFIVVDDVETSGNPRKLPLWLFGFLY